MKTMGRRVLAMLMILAMLIPTMNFASAAPAVERIDLNIDAITIGVGQKVKTVEPVAYPEGSSTKFTWESADKSIAKVNSKGKITGVKKGDTTITITASNGVKAELDVSVVKKGKGVTAIKLNKKSATITRGKTLKLKATLTPKKPKDKDIIWVSSDESIATVDSNGKVKAVAVGTATISAISSSGKTAKCKVTVEGVKVKKIKLKGKKNILREEPMQLTAVITPEDADNQELKWKSSNKKVATVDKNGVVTGVKKGTATITATAKDGSGVSASFKVTVQKAVFIPTPTPTPEPTPVPTATPTPEPTATPTVKPTEEPTATPTVKPTEKPTATPTVKPTEKPTATPTVKPTEKPTATPTVKPTEEPVETPEATQTETPVETPKPTETASPAMSIALKGDVENLYVGRQTSNWEVEYNRNDVPVVTYTYTNEGILDENGVALSAGETDVTVKVTGAEASAEATYTVVVTEFGIALKEEAVELVFGDEYEFELDAELEEGAEIEWTSSPAGIVEFAESGNKFTAIGEGEATVTCTVTLKDGITASASAAVEVRPVPVLNIVLMGDVEELYVGRSTSNWELDYNYGDYAEPEIEVIYANDGILDETGLALAAGETVVTVKATGAGLSAEETYTVIVTEFAVELNTNAVVMNVDETFDLAIVSPVEANSFTSWEITGDDGVVSFNEEDRVLTAIGTGKATVTCTVELGDGITASASAKVTVYDPAIELPMSQGYVTMNIGDEWWPGINDMPGGEHYVKWSTTDASVAVVNPDGKVVAKGLGETNLVADITYGTTDEEGNFTEEDTYYATAVISVEEPRFESGIEVTELMAYVGTLIDFAWDPWYNGMGEWEASFKSSDPDVLTNDGEAIAVGPADFTVTFTTRNITHTHVIKVTVVDSPIKLNVNMISNFVGLSQQLEIVEGNEGIKAIEWSSDNEDVATVDENGLVQLLSVGYANITCNVVYNDGNTYASTSVIAAPFDFELWFDEEYDTHMWVGDVKRTHPYVHYCNVPDHKVELDMEILEGDCVEPDEELRLRAQAAGTAKVKVIAKYYLPVEQDGETRYEQFGHTEEIEYDVVVEDIEAHLNVGLDQPEEFEVGNIQTVNFWYNCPVEITSQTLEIADTSIATVSSNGSITALKPGETTLTYTIWARGYSKSATVDIIVRGAEASLEPASKRINAGESYTVVANVGELPEGYYLGENHEFWSDNDFIASIDYDGIVTGISEGTTTIYYGIYAYSDEEGKPELYVRGSATVTVVGNVGKLVLSATELNLYPGVPQQLMVKTVVDEGTEVIWEVDEGWAVMDDEGYITNVETPHMNHILNVTCYATVDGEEVSAKCLLKPAYANAYVDYVHPYYYPSVEEEFEIYYELTGDATGYELVWESDNEEIVAVNENGLATAIAEGEANIILTIMDGDKPVSRRSTLIRVGAERPELEAFGFNYDDMVMTVEGKGPDRYEPSLFMEPDDCWYYMGDWYLESSDESVIKIVNRREMVSVGAGEATVTVYLNEDPSITDTIKVYVIDPSFEIEDAKDEYKTGDSFNIIIKGVPEEILAREEADFGVDDYDEGVMYEIGREDSTITMRVCENRNNENGDGMHVYFDFNADPWIGYGEYLTIHISGDERGLNCYDYWMNPGERLWPDANFGWMDAPMYELDDKGVVFVDEFDHLVAEKLGDTNVIVTLTDGNTEEELAFEIAIHVVEREWELVSLDRIPSNLVSNYEYYGFEHNIDTIISGHEGPDYSFEISEDDKDVAYYDYDRRCVVTVNPGTFTLNVYAQYDGDDEVQFKSKVIRVTEPVVRLEQLYMDVRPGVEYENKLFFGQGYEEAGAAATVEWSTNNEAIYVNDNGKIYANANEGDAKITGKVMFNDGETDRTEYVSCYVHVFRDDEIKLDVWHNEYNQYEFNVGIEHEIWFELDTNAWEYVEVVWRADNEEIVEFEQIFDEEGNLCKNGIIVKGVGEGYTQLYCDLKVPNKLTGEDGPTSGLDFHVTLNQPVFDIGFNNEGEGSDVFQVPVGETGGPDWYERIEYVDIISHRMYSADESIAVVRRDEWVEGIRAGTTTITKEYVYEINGVRYEDSITATVEVVGPSAWFSEESVELEVGGTYDLKYFDNSDVHRDYEQYTPYSMDADIADVEVRDDGTLTVTAKKPGTTFLVYTMANDEGNVDGFCRVDVVGAHTDEEVFYITDSYVGLYRGQSHQYNFVYNGKGEYTNVKWWTDAEHFFETTDDGLVTNVDGNELGDHFMNEVHCSIEVNGETLETTAVVAALAPTFRIYENTFGREGQHYHDFNVEDECDLTNMEDIVTFKENANLDIEFTAGDEGVFEVVDNSTLKVLKEGIDNVYMTVTDTDTNESYTWMFTGLVNQDRTLQEMGLRNELIVWHNAEGEIWPDFVNEPAYAAFDWKMTSDNHDVTGEDPETNNPIHIVGYGIANITVTEIREDDFGNVSDGMSCTFKMVVLNSEETRLGLSDDVEQNFEDVDRDEKPDVSRGDELQLKIYGVPEEAMENATFEMELPEGVSMDENLKVSINSAGEEDATIYLTIVHSGGDRTYLEYGIDINCVASLAEEKGRTDFERMETDIQLYVEGLDTLREMYPDEEIWVEYYSEHDGIHVDHESGVMSIWCACEDETHYHEVYADVCIGDWFRYRLGFGFNVTAPEEYFYITGANFELTRLNIYEGWEYWLTDSIQTNLNLDDYELQFEVEDTEVASVNEEGMLTAISAGYTTVTARALLEGEIKHEFTMDVNVFSKDELEAPVLDLSDRPVYLTLEDEYGIYAHWVDSKFDVMPFFRYSTSNADVVAIRNYTDNEGNFENVSECEGYFDGIDLEILSVGEAEITVYAEYRDGETVASTSVTFTIIVENPAEEPEGNPEEGTEGEPEVNPEEGTEGEPEVNPEEGTEVEPEGPAGATEGE